MPRGHWASPISTEICAKISEWLWDTFCSNPAAGRGGWNTPTYNDHVLTLRQWVLIRQAFSWPWKTDAEQFVRTDVSCSCLTKTRRYATFSVVYRKNWFDLNCDHLTKRRFGLPKRKRRERRVGYSHLKRSCVNVETMGINTTGVQLAAENMQNTS